MSRPSGIVPAGGFPSLLVSLSAAATAVLAVGALCLGLAASRIAGAWETELGRAATVRVEGTAEELPARVGAALAVLSSTPGIVSARALSEAELAALLAPWLGADVPVDLLPVPRLIAVVETAAGPDRDSLARQLAGQAPGASYDDHAEWRRPLRAAAGGLQATAAAAALLALGLVAVIVTLAARAALAANRPIVTALRLIGAADGFIVAAFVRRLATSALAGSVAGTALAAGLVALLPTDETPAGILPALAPAGTEWAALAAVPAVAGLVAVLATRGAARAALAETP